MIVLDEPTNNLDLDARRGLYAAVESWPGVMLIVSHDRELLALMDQIAELTGPPVSPGDSLACTGGTSRRTRRSWRPNRPRRGARSARRKAASGGRNAT